jgi:hypothetical protein
MVCLPVDVEPYVAVHFRVLPDAAHEGVEKEPPELLEENETVPDGTPSVVEERGTLLTVAVQVVRWFTGKLVGLQATVVLVGASVTVVVVVTVVVLVAVVVEVDVTEAVEVVVDVVVEVTVVVVVTGSGWRATPASAQDSLVVAVTDAGKSVGDATPEVAYSVAKSNPPGEVNPAPPANVQEALQPMAARRNAPGRNWTLDDVEIEQEPEQVPVPVALCASVAVTPETS